MNIICGSIMFLVTAVVATFLDKQLIQLVECVD